MWCDYSTQQDSFHVKFYEPWEGKLSVFSLLESLKNIKIRFQSDLFRKISLQGPRKNKIIPGELFWSLGTEYSFFLISPVGLEKG
jgi:hypothetical protein